jgi:tellurite resistance protein
MPDLGVIRQLPDVGPERLALAVRAALGRQRDAAAPTRTVQLPALARLRAGAAESIKAEAEDARTAEYFQSLLELGYLVASADGLAVEERDALAHLVEHATGAVVSSDVLQLHFADLGATCEALGRRERLGRIAANFDQPGERSEALGFATLVAIADGALTEPERKVLVELGAHFSLSAGQVDEAIEQVAIAIERELEP